MKSAIATILTMTSFVSLVNADQPPESPAAEKPKEQAVKKPVESPDRKPNDEKASAAPTENRKLSKVALLSEDELNQLLGQRVNGGLGMTFGQFGNMFLVKSRLEIGTGIGLMTTEKKIVRSELQSSFPESYRPTLRELLDLIALQTSSEWKYDPAKQLVDGEVEQDKPIKDLAMFDFTITNRKKPFSIKLAEDWKSEDKGNWVMYIPPEFPVGMDIYEMGRYSTNEKDKKAFFERIRADVALEWAQRVNPSAKAEDLKPANVGKFEALFYDKLLKGQGKKLHWRHWVFMVEDRCYFIVSTIAPSMEEEILPDVEAMVKSFKSEE